MKSSTFPQVSKDSTFKPFENYKLNSGSLEVKLDSLTNNLCIENKVKNKKYFINATTGEHNLTTDFTTVYGKLTKLKEYVEDADTVLQGQINKIVTEIGTIDGNLPVYNDKITELQKKLNDAFNNLEKLGSDITTTNKNIDIINTDLTLINTDLTKANEEIKKANNDIEASNKEVNNKFIALNSTVDSETTRINDAFNKLTETEKELTDYKTETDKTINGLQTTTTNLQLKQTDTEKTFSEYKTSTNATIKGLEATTTNLQSQQTNTEKTISDYKTSTDATINGLQTKTTNLQSQQTTTDNNLNNVKSSLSEYKTSTDATIKGLQTTTTNLQKKQTNTEKTISDYKTSTDATINGLQTKTTNLQSQQTATDNNLNNVKSSLSDYKTSTDATINGLQTTTTNLQSQQTNTEKILSDYKTSTNATIKGLQTTTTNLQAKQTDTEKTISEYKTSTDATINSLQTTATNLQSKIGLNGNEITTLKSLTASISDDVISLNTLGQAHTTDIKKLNDVVSQKADITILTAMEAKIDDKIAVQISNVVDVTNSISANIEGLGTEIVNITNNITNQVTINNNFITNITELKTETGAVKNEIGTNNIPGKTIWGEITNIRNSIPKINCIANYDAAYASEMKTNLLKGPSGAYWDMHTSGYPKTNTLLVNNEMAIAGLLKLSSSYPGSPTGATSHTSESRTKIAQTLGTYDIFNTLTNAITQLKALTGKTDFTTTLANSFKPADLNYDSAQSELYELKTFTTPPYAQNIAIEICEVKDPKKWTTNIFYKYRIKLYKINNCIWLSNNESEILLYYPDPHNPTTFPNEQLIRFFTYPIPYGSFTVENTPIYPKFPFPKFPGSPEIKIPMLNRLVPRGGYDILNIENEFSNQEIPQHKHYINSSGNKSGLCTWDNKENATNSGSGVRYIFAGNRSSWTYSDVFEPCNDCESGNVVGSTNRNSTILAKPASSFKAYYLNCVYRIPYSQKDISLRDIIASIYTSNFCTAGKNIIYINSNPWGDREINDIFL